MFSLMLVMFFLAHLYHLLSLPLSLLLYIKFNLIFQAKKYTLGAYDKSYSVLYFEI